MSIFNRWTDLSEDTKRAVCWSVVRPSRKLGMGLSEDQLQEMRDAGFFEDNKYGGDKATVDGEELRRMLISFIKAFSHDS